MRAVKGSLGRSLLRREKEHQEDERARLDCLLCSRVARARKTISPHPPAVSAFSRRLFKKTVQQGRRRSNNQRRYHQGYVEDSCEPRTPLAGFFNNLLEVMLCHAVSQRIAGDFEEPAGF